MKQQRTPWFSYLTPPNENRPGRYECTCGGKHYWDGKTFTDINYQYIRAKDLGRWRGLTRKAVETENKEPT